MESMTYYHGGPAGLRHTRLVLPPTETGVPSCCDFGAAGIARRDRVYLTTELEAARLFALLGPFHGDAAIYRVAPEGEVEPDPDCDTPGMSWQCPRARVLATVCVISARARKRHLAKLAGAEVRACH